jgi:predicted molibdopterin-dependent oxidoreductase YjgC
MVVTHGGPKVEEGRQSVLEFILVNHPIDCPVCDQAGECKLQDYYMKLDRKPSRMEEEKVQKKRRCGWAQRHARHGALHPLLALHPFLPGSGPRRRACASSSAATTRS